MVCPINPKKAGQELLEFLERRGFVSEGDVSRLENWKAKDLLKLHEPLWELIYRNQYEAAPQDAKPDEFRFLAGASLRGDRCKHCRAEKLDLLGRFAALYCDELILPVHLQRPSRRLRSSKACADLQSTLSAVLQLRPLVEEGVVLPAVMTTRHCEHIGPFIQHLINLADMLAEDLATDNFKRFRMFYEPSVAPDESPTVYLEGPPEYIEHGGLVVEYPDPPSWVAKSWSRSRSSRVKVPVTKMHRTGLIQHLFESIAIDTTFQLAYGAAFKAKYLTDLPGEAEMLRLFAPKDELSERADILCAGLGHSLPFVQDLPIRKILKLRRDIYESFQQYRYALSSLLKEQVNDKTRFTARQAKTLYEDVLAPKIAQLEAQVASERQHLRKKTMATSGLISIVVTLGLAGALTPLQALALLGGATTLRLSDYLAETASDSSAVASNEFYFLLKLKAAAANAS